MRLSNLFLSTLKETPADAEIMSHKLMLRAGMIRKVATGLYTWLPLGLRVLKKVEAVIRKEMNHIHAQEILMPAIQPAELWQETKRWFEYGPLLLKIFDRHKREYCFGPTHEEIATDLARRELKSYKQLPVTLYQIQMKFRDEIRPRFGLMRAREFLMKDAYSFHLNQASLEETYNQMYEAYSRIFTRLGLKFRAVFADTGNIGGSFSHEFHVLADSGEDLIAFSTEGEYAANIELAPALPPKTKPTPGNAPLDFVKTPGIKSVEDQAQYLKMPEENILKTLLVTGKTKEHPVVALLLRGNHTLNPFKAEKHPLVASPFTLISVEEVQKIAGCGPGFVGPKGLKVPIIADHSVPLMVDFMCGANKEDTHYSGFNWGRDCPLSETFDLRHVLEGDPAPDGKGTYAFKRGIEVGHIFQLGDKYSQAMQLSVLGESGESIVPLMGSYGIGVSRIVAAAIEQNHDEKGMIWPLPLAPFQVVLVPILFHKSAGVKEATEKLYKTLLEEKLEVLLDDREERAGVMFADADLIGIPYRIVISEKTLNTHSVELKSRVDENPSLLPLARVVDFLKTALE